MQKVLVAEISNESTILNAFGNLDTENPLLLGQGIFPSTVVEGDEAIALKSAIADLENDIGPIGSFREIPFFVASSGSSLQAVQEISRRYGTNARIFSYSEAIIQATRMIYEEVGDALVLDVRGASTNVYSVTSSTDKHTSNQKFQSLVKETLAEDLGVFTNPLALVKLIGEGGFLERHGQEWAKLLKPWPEKPEEMALSAELTAAAVSIALKRHIGRNSLGSNDEVTILDELDLRQVRWIVGTGQALTQLPNNLEIMRESIKGIGEALVPYKGIPVLIDKECIMAALGGVSTSFRRGAWQLLRESFGVEN